MYSVAKVEEEPIIIAHLWGDVDITVAKQDIAQQVANLIEEAGGGPHWRIFDYTGFKMTFTDMLFGLAFETSGEPGTTMDEQIRPIFVGEDPHIAEKAEALRQAQYGSLDIPVFETLDEALEYVHMQETTA